MAADRFLAWLKAFGSRLDGAWRRRSLTFRFALISTLILAHAMPAIGFAAGKWIEAGLVNAAASETALAIDELMDVHIPSLAPGATLSADDRLRLARALNEPAHHKGNWTYRIWQSGATVLGNDPEAPRGAREASLVQAHAGKIVAKFEPARRLTWRTRTPPVLRVFTPIREHSNLQIIAIVETAEAASELANSISVAKAQIWLLVGAVGLGVFLLQLVVVHGGSQLISEQRVALDQKVDDLSRLLSENERLSRNATEASQRIAETNERTLRRIGADLHDGPVQLLGAAVLHLDSVGEELANHPAALSPELREDMDVMRETLQDCLTDIRNLSAGLAPPEIENLPLADMLRTVARRHERRTGVPVACEFGELPEAVPFPLKTCIYRVAQEGLNNAFRHAGGKDQRIEAAMSSGGIEIVIQDSGPGFDATAPSVDGQGLQGLRDRIESLAGTMKIVTAPGQGTQLVARFRLAATELAHV